MTRFLIPARKAFHAAHSTINISLNSVQAEILNCGACSEAIVSNFLKIINNQIMQWGIFFLALKQMWKCSLGMWPPYKTAGKILGLSGESSRKSEPVVRDMPRPPTAELGQTGLNPSPPDPTTKFQGDNAALSLVWSSLSLWPAKPATTGSREQCLSAAFVGRPMSVESADLPPPLQRSAEVEHTEGSQMPFWNSVSEVLQGNTEWLRGSTPVNNWWLRPVFLCFSNSFR